MEINEKRHEGRERGNTRMLELLLCCLKYLRIEERCSVYYSSLFYKKNYCAWKSRERILFLKVKSSTVQYA
jgi:hypothetical protein